MVHLEGDDFVRFPFVASVGINLTPHAACTETPFNGMNSTTAREQTQLLLPPPMAATPTCVHLEARMKRIGGTRQTDYESRFCSNTAWDSHEIEADLHISFFKKRWRFPWQKLLSL